MDWIGLDWIGLDWIGLDWIGLDSFGLVWLVWVGLDSFGLVGLCVFFICDHAYFKPVSFLFHSFFHSCFMPADSFE